MTTSHLDLQINLLSEQEHSKMLAMLEALLRHYGLVQPDPEVTSLEEATQPDMLAQQIEESLERKQPKDTTPEKSPQTSWDWHCVTLLRLHADVLILAWLLWLVYR